MSIRLNDVAQWPGGILCVELGVGSATTGFFWPRAQVEDKASDMTKPPWDFSVPKDAFDISLRLSDPRFYSTYLCW